MEVSGMKIKIVIIDREIVLRDVPAGQEERLRRAGKIINDQVREYRARAKGSDNQFLLSLVAFHAMVDKIRLEEDVADLSAVSDEINYLDQLLSSAL